MENSDIKIIILDVHQSLTNRYEKCYTIIPTPVSFQR